MVGGPLRAARRAGGALSASAAAAGVQRHGIVAYFRSGQRYRGRLTHYFEEKSNAIPNPINVQKLVTLLPK